MSMPKVQERFYWHEDCWNEKFKAQYITMPESMENLFGEFLEPESEKTANASNKKTLDGFFNNLSK